MESAFESVLLILAALGVFAAYALFRSSLGAPSASTRAAALSIALHARLGDLAKELEAESAGHGDGRLEAVNTLIAHGDLEGAEEAARTMVSADPEALRYRVKLVEALTLGGKLEQAKAELDALEAMRAPPDA